jgi:hypothetical protein
MDDRTDFSAKAITDAFTFGKSARFATRVDARSGHCGMPLVQAVKTCGLFVRAKMKEFFLILLLNAL